jgi:GTP-binding protein HflX
VELELKLIADVGLVGLPNAGKSTLLNKLSGAGVLVADQFFATLDPTTRRVELPGARRILLSDTVGFIQKLPTTVVAAFRATLEEIAEADLLLHIVDITHPNASAQAEAVRMTLTDIEVRDVPMVTALNKIDLLDQPESAFQRVDDFDRAVPISAATGEGIPALLTALGHELFESMSPISVRLPYKAGRLISLFHQQGVIDHIEHTRSAVHIEGRLPNRYLSEFRTYEHVPPERAVLRE